MATALQASGVAMDPGAKVAWASSPAEAKVLKGMGKMVISGRPEMLTAGAALAIVEDGGKPKILLHRANLAAKGPALKLGNDYKLAAYIEQKIVEERYSPEAVLLKIKEERLTFSVTLSKWTLYSYITKGVFLGVTNKNLPRKGKKKNKRGRRW